MNRTNLTVKDEGLWKWAKIRAIELGYNGVSEYIFDLIGRDKNEKRKKHGRSK